VKALDLEKTCGKHGQIARRLAHADPVILDKPAGCRSVKPADPEMPALFRFENSLIIDRPGCSQPAISEWECRAILKPPTC
jgi:hypothetical protein